MLINRLPIRPRKSTLLLRPPVGIGSLKEREIVEDWQVGRISLDLRAQSGYKLVTRITYGKSFKLP